LLIHIKNLEGIKVRNSSELPVAKKKCLIFAALTIGLASLVFAAGIATPVIGPVVQWIE
jgi:hypothetical protein